MTLFDQFVTDFRGKKILILGLGLLGSSLGDAQLFAEIGCQLRITDLKQAENLKSSLDQLSGIKADYILGSHRTEDVDWADIVLRSAAVPWEHPVLIHARLQNKPVYMDASLFLEYARGVTSIGITGTRGKTTTTQLIFSAAKLTGKTVLLGGNVKDTATLPQLKLCQNPEQTTMVMELSSWQLQSFFDLKLSPHIAVLTNLYPDHLNIYRFLTEYYRDKKAIFLNQKKGDLVFFNNHVEEFKQWAHEAPGKICFFDTLDLPKDFTWSLKGEHNLQNLAAALAVGRALGIRESDLLNLFRHFEPIPYRLEVIRNLNGVTFINDTTSTTPTALIAALNATTSPEILIMGGTDKNLPLDELAAKLNQNKALTIIMLTGSGTAKLLPLIDSQKIKLVTKSLEDAVNLAYSIAIPGQNILFSPGFTSFGLFNNEYHRGDEFSRLVKLLG
jgi:UDP-N-acetylmuramoylalanine--D-glutamate ligase